MPVKTLPAAIPYWIGAEGVVGVGVGVVGRGVGLVGRGCGWLGFYKAVDRGIGCREVGWWVVKPALDPQDQQSQGE